MGCLSSENLKEREEVLVSTMMVAQRAADSWSTLLTFAGSSKQIAFFPAMPRPILSCRCEQSCTESQALACHRQLGGDAGQGHGKVSSRALRPLASKRDRP